MSRANTERTTTDPRKEKVRRLNIALSEPGSSERSNREIARTIGVDECMVRRHRAMRKAEEKRQKDAQRKREARMKKLAG